MSYACVQVCISCFLVCSQFCCTAQSLAAVVTGFSSDVSVLLTLHLLSTTKCQHQLRHPHHTVTVIAPSEGCEPWSARDRKLSMPWSLELGSIKSFLLGFQNPLFNIFHAPPGPQVGFRSEICINLGCDVAGRAALALSQNTSNSDKGQIGQPICSNLSSNGENFTMVPFSHRLSSAF